MRYLSFATYLPVTHYVFICHSPCTPSPQPTAMTGSQSIFTRADMRGITEEEEKAEKLAQLGLGGVEDDEEGEDASDVSGDEGEEEVGAGGENPAAMDARVIRERVRRDQGKKWSNGKGKSRNMTKGITKYGKIDRSFRGGLG